MPEIAGLLRRSSAPGAGYLDWLIPIGTRRSECGRVDVMLFV